MRCQLGRTAFVGLILVLLSVPRPQLAIGQVFPKKPVTLVIPSGAGGIYDFTARALASKAKDYLGQPIIVDPRPGGSGAIGSEAVAMAQPDGYTLLMGGYSHNCALPAIEGRSKGPYDLEAVCHVVYNTLLLVARPDAPFKNLKEMIEWAKANPGKLVVGNSGPWGASDLLFKQLSKKMAIQVRIVPYDGLTQSLTAVLGGHVDVAGSSPVAALPYKNTGKLKMVAIMDSKRSIYFPDVATGIEEGVDIVSRTWTGVMAPKGTPRPVIDRLATAFKKMIEDKSVINFIENSGNKILYLGPDEFAKFWRAEFDSYKELGKMFKK